MAILQVVAARMAEVGEIVYHTFNEEGTQGFQEGMRILKEEIFKSDEKEISFKAFLERLLEQEFKWGVSDGN